MSALLRTIAVLSVTLVAASGSAQRGFRPPPRAYESTGSYRPYESTRSYRPYESTGSYGRVGSSFGEPPVRSPRRSTPPDPIEAYRRAMRGTAYDFTETPYRPDLRGARTSWHGPALRVAWPLVEATPAERAAELRRAAAPPELIAIVPTSRAAYESTYRGATYSAAARREMVESAARYRALDARRVSTGDVDASYRTPRERLRDLVISGLQRSRTVVVSAHTEGEPGQALAERLIVLPDGTHLTVAELQAMAGDRGGLVLVVTCEARELGIQGRITHQVAAGALERVRASVPSGAESAVRAYFAERDLRVRTQRVAAVSGGAALIVVAAVALAADDD